METKQMLRVFKHGNITLADPNPAMSVQEVSDFFSNQYPELTNSSVDGPEIINDQLVFNFTTKTGTKG